MQKKKIKNKKILSMNGFTLIELLMGILIMGILTLLALPVISNLQQNNEVSKYAKYEDAMIVSAKLYTDAYDIDMFGNENPACYDIRYEEMIKKNLLKNIQIEDVTCNFSDSYVKVQKTKSKHNFQVSLVCKSESNGSIIYENKIKSEDMICNDPESNIGDGEYISPSAPKITIDKTPSASDIITDKNYKVKITVSDDEGLAESNILQYKWTDVTGTTGKWKVVHFQNAESVLHVSTHAKKPEPDGEYYLYIQPIKIMDIHTNTIDKLQKYGPFIFDTVPPKCPDITSSTAPNVWTKDNITFTFTGLKDTDVFDWITKTNTNDWVTRSTNNKAKNVKSKTITGEGKRQIKLNVRNTSGVEAPCEHEGIYLIDKTKPKITTETQKASEDNLSIELQDQDSALSGYKITTSKTVPKTWDKISGKVYENTFTKSTDTYYVHAKDVAGNTNYKEVKVQNIPAPSCTIQKLGTIGEGNWYVSDVTIKTNIKGQNITKKGLDTKKNPTNGKTSIKIEKNLKETTYYCYVENASGSNTNKTTVKIDKLAPSIGYSTSVATKNNMSLTFKDSYSGLDAYAVDTSSKITSKTKWKSISGTEKKITATGVHGANYVHVRDKAGNTKTSKAINVKTMNKPTCSISITKGKSKTVKKNKWYYTESVTATMKVTGTASKKGISLTNTTATNGNTIVSTKNDGTNLKFYGYVENVAGSDKCSLTIKKDSKAPQFVEKIKSWQPKYGYGARFGYRVKEPGVGVDESTIRYEYCYTGHTNVGCGATCKNPNIYSIRSKINTKDKTYYYQEGSDYWYEEVWDVTDGQHQFQLKGGVSDSCVKGYGIRAYFKVCDLLGHCNSTSRTYYDF